MGEELTPEQLENEEFNETIFEDIDNQYLLPIDIKFRKRQITIPEYFQAVKEAQDSFIENNQDDQEFCCLGKQYFLNALILETDFIRKKNTRKTEENLAIKDAEWQIGIAEYYQTYKDDPSTLPVINSFLRRLEKTSDILGFDREKTEGKIRGAKGLITAMNALEKSGHITKLPSPEQDAQEGIDLFSVDIKSVCYFTWQIKTSGSRQGVLIGQAESDYDSYDDELEDFDRSVRKIAKSTQELESSSGLTIKPMYCIIPEQGIDKSLTLDQRASADFQNALAEGGRYARI